MTVLESNCCTLVVAFNEVEHRGPSLSEIRRALRIEKQSAARIVHNLISKRALTRSGTVPGLNLNYPHTETP